MKRMLGIVAVLSLLMASPLLAQPVGDSHSPVESVLALFVGAWYSAIDSIEDLFDDDPEPAKVSDASDEMNGTLDPEG